MEVVYLKRTNNEDPDFKILIHQLDKELADLYESFQTVYDAFNKLDPIDTVVVAYRDHVPVGCGCYKRYDDTTAEIKRMYVDTRYRGKGISKLILVELETWAASNGYLRLILETGTKQPEAIGLYSKLEYKRTPNFGQYKNMDESVCFEKQLSATSVL